MIRKLSTAALLSATVALSACAGGKDAPRDTQYVARDVATLYNAAKDRLDRGQYRVAAALFGEVERQHPFSPWARRAQLMAAFSSYMGRNYTDAIGSASRFVANNPGNKDAPYAYYLIAVSHYEQIGRVDRDQSSTRSALAALGTVIDRYPDTTYATDARVKRDLVLDQLAAKEMSVGRFYQDRGQWLAATLRFREVVDNYQQTRQVQEALYRLTESYLALGIPDEAQKSAAVLGRNYPGSEWYQRAYSLMQEKAPAAS